MSDKDIWSLTYDVVDDDVGDDDDDDDNFYDNYARDVHIDL